MKKFMLALFCIVTACTRSGDSGGAQRENPSPAPPPPRSSPTPRPVATCSQKGFIGKLGEDDLVRIKEVLDQPSVIETSTGHRRAALQSARLARVLNETFAIDVSLELATDCGAGEYLELYQRIFIP